MTRPHLPDPALLPNQRHLFDIPDEVAFLNCAYMSPLPKVATRTPFSVSPGTLIAFLAVSNRTPIRLLPLSPL